MKIIHLEFKDQDYKDELLSHLRGQIFHITTIKTFDDIKKTNFIFHNKDSKFSINTGSLKSFGRKRGYVCLFDLREKEETVIQEALDKYYFLGPNWFAEYHEDYYEFNLAYLIMNSRFYNKIVPTVEAKKICRESRNYEQYIPEAECWYPDDMPINSINRTLLVKIWKSAPPKESPAYAFHKLILEDKR
ncbi:MAG: hypothetical protein CMD96_06330 [Gammaproteobacteria bacterium]|nr:hypothetical protein [Gammaproteobacteria bacterium]HJP18097.1 hypothetical protein [Nitrospinota bacterium]|tara:strand:+ start:163 stop:729 length:567 start_codon:yes stop_codon:yes gene_type:complete